MKQKGNTQLPHRFHACLFFFSFNWQDILITQIIYLETIVMNTRAIRLRIEINAVNNFIIQMVPVGSKNDKHKELGISEKRLIITVVQIDTVIVSALIATVQVIENLFFLRFLSNGYFTTMNLQNVQTCRWNFTFDKEQRCSWWIEKFVKIWKSFACHWVLIHWF